MKSMSLPAPGQRSLLTQGRTSDRGLQVATLRAPWRQAAWGQLKRDNEAIVYNTQLAVLGQQVDSVTKSRVQGPSAAPPRVSPSPPSSTTAFTHPGLHGAPWHVSVVDKPGYTIALQAEAQFSGLGLKQLVDVMYNDHPACNRLYGMDKVWPVHMPAAAGASTLGRTEKLVLFVGHFAVLTLTQKVRFSQQWYDAQGRPCAAPQEDVTGDHTHNASTSSGSSTSRSSQQRPVSCVLQCELLESNSVTKLAATTVIREAPGNSGTSGGSGQDGPPVLHVSYQVAVSPVGIPYAMRGLPLFAMPLVTAVSSQAKQLLDKYSYLADKVKAVSSNSSSNSSSKGSSAAATPRASAAAGAAVACALEEVSREMEAAGGDLSVLLARHQRQQRQGAAGR